MLPPARGPIWRESDAAVVQSSSSSSSWSCVRVVDPVADGVVDSVVDSVVDLVVDSVADLVVDLVVDSAADLVVDPIVVRVVVVRVAVERGVLGRVVVSASSLFRVASARLVVVGGRAALVGATVAAAVRDARGFGDVCEVWGMRGTALSWSSVSAPSVSGGVSV
jgi:hypothetical protein